MLTPQSRTKLVDVLRRPVASRATCPGRRAGRRRGHLRRHRPGLGVARLGGQRRQRHPARGQAELHRAARRVPPAARRARPHHRQALRADRVPAGRAGQDGRRLRGPQDLPLPRLRDRAGLRLPRLVGGPGQPAVGAAGARPARPDNPDFSVDVAIDGWIARGAPRGKLVLGIPYYGQGWTGVTGGATACSARPPARRRASSRPAPRTGRRSRSCRAGFKVTGTCGPGTPGSSTAPRSGRTTTRCRSCRRRLHPHQGLGGAMMWSLDGDDDNATLTRPSPPASGRPDGMPFGA